MTLKVNVSVDDYAGLDPAIQNLYQERNGNYELRPIEGLKTQADIDRLQSALTKERESRKAVEAKFAGLDSVLAEVGTVEELVSKLDKFSELEVLASESTDKVNKAVEARLNTEKKAYERELSKISEQLQAKESLLNTLQAEKRTSTINEAIRKVASDMKIRPEAIDDVLLYGQTNFDVLEDGQIVTKEGSSFGANISVADWLQDMQPKRAHWWPESVNANATGGKGNGTTGKNPFDKASLNITQQQELLRTNPQLAKSYAQKAGVDLEKLGISV